MIDETDENFRKLADALTHIAERIEIEDDITAEDLGYVLGTAPLGGWNPAIEAANATCRFLAGQMDKKTYMDRLKYWTEAVTDFSP